MSRGYTFLILLALLAFITSCAAPQKHSTIACKEILENITPTSLQGVEKSAINEWVLERYPIGRSTIQESLDYGVPRDRYTRYDWHYNDSLYTAFFMEERFASLRVMPQPSLSGGDFTACLGDPDFYTAAYTWASVPHLLLFLWYADEGILIYQVLLPDYNRFQKYVPEIKRDTRFTNSTSVFYMATTDIETMVSTFYNPTQEPQNDERTMQELEALRVWESWDTIHIEIEHRLQ